jgi:hypothetical protein
MASPPIPPPLMHLGARPFSFYPAILNAEPNEWLCRKATWQELVAVNRKTGQELSIPRRFLGSVSSTDDPILIVGLLRELEFKNGAALPYRNRVIEMPIAVGETAGPRFASPRHGALAPVIGIRLESKRDRRAIKIVGGALAASIFLFAVGTNLSHVGEIKQRTSAARRHAYLSLRRTDDYAVVVRKLGPPASDRWLTDAAGSYRALGYADRRFTVILHGSEGEQPRYIGTMDQGWHPLDPAGAASGLMSGLKRF